MIELGAKVRDKVTGFLGIATSRCEYLNGCVQYGVKTKVDKEGKMVEIEYIDEQQLEVMPGRKPKVKAKPTGGLQSDRPSH